MPRFVAGNHAVFSNFELLATIITPKPQSHKTRAIMLYSQKDAPRHILEEEWIESLLCDRVDGGVKPLQDLIEEEW